MQDSDGRAAPAPPLVAIHHRHDARAWVLASALATVGMKAALLPPPEEDAAAWRDCRFDILAFDPFDARAAPRPRIDLARAIAARQPLIILSDRDAVEDRMLALTAGADDAVGWGADPIEAVARIAGLLRRARMAPGRIDCDDLHIDLIDRRVERAGRPIRLPLREFDLLANLARVPDRPVSRATLLRAVWQIDFDPGTNRVEVHMSRLRARIDHGFGWPMLHTVKGHGYALRTRGGKLA